MQVSSSLIAAQAAAREAQARFHAQNIQAAPGQVRDAQPLKAARPAAATADGFMPLPLRQTLNQTLAPAQPQAGAHAPGQARLGQHIDITV